MRNPLHAGDVFYFTRKNIPTLFYRLVDEDGMVKNICTGGYTTMYTVIHSNRTAQNKGPYLVIATLDYSNYEFDV